ncbi:MAG: hypothetical protein HKK66_11835 [Chlorobiaceae bacterium]|nr:hypothetical protein [Chlorobiaceae bacterium]
MKRLLAALFTGIAHGYSINHIEISRLDVILAYLPVSILFTAFAAAGVSNAINITDGFNGLDGGTLMICFTALGYIAWFFSRLGLSYALNAQCPSLSVDSTADMLLPYKRSSLFHGKALPEKNKPRLGS